LVELHQVKDLSVVDNVSTFQALQDALEEPDRADTHFNLGKELRLMIKLPEARQELETAYKLCTDPALKNQIVHFIQVKMPKKEIAVNPIGQYDILSGSFYDRKGDYAKAAGFYKKAIAEAPGFEWPYQQLALVYYDLKNYAQAIQLAQQALALNPGFYPSYLTLGDVEIDLKHYEKALNYYQRALAIHGQSDEGEGEDLTANIHNQIGFANEALGRTQLALADYKKAYDIAPEDSDDFAYASDALERLKRQASL
jgi:tetratricopeptide (TPR) repeat protein